MQPADFLCEIVSTLRNLSVLLAILLFWALLRISAAAGLIGLPLLIALLPACARYLVGLVEARASARAPASPSIESFGFWSDAWAMTPLIPFAILLLGRAWFGSAAPEGAAVLTVVAGAFVLPASLGVLALTHSPLESLNPAAMFRLVRAAGVAYFMVPAFLLVMAALIAIVAALGMPRPVVEIAAGYEFALMCTMTGAVLRAHDLPLAVAIAPAAAEAPESRDNRRVTARRAVVNHAYGFISRGNLDGGLRHVLLHLEPEPDVGAAMLWYFGEMMRWESPDAALRFGRTCLTRFLDQGDDAKALKLVASCLHASARWHPETGDRDRTLDLLRRCGREDLVRQLTR